MTDDEKKMLGSAAAGRHLYSGFDAVPGMPGETSTAAYKAMASLIEAGLLDDGGRITDAGRDSARGSSPGSQAGAAG